MNIMRKIILSVLVVLIGLNLYAQKLNTISLLGKTDTTYQFTITGKNLDQELSKLKTTFGKPLSESPGAIIWDKVEIPSVGKDLQIKLIDGLLTVKEDNANFKSFKNTKNKNKSKNCQLKCLDENQNRQIYFTVMDKDNNNIINNAIMKKAVIVYLQDILK